MKHKIPKWYDVQLEQVAIIEQAMAKLQKAVNAHAAAVRRKGNIEFPLVETSKEERLSIVVLRDQIDEFEELVAETLNWPSTTKALR